MNLKSIVAIFVLAAMPVCSHAQQGGSQNPPKPTKADAQRVVQIISADKAKTQQYCDLAKLNDQIEQADKNKDLKKSDELSQQALELAQKLGPEYAALMTGLDQLDPTSKDGQEIDNVLDGLDKLCPKK
jgi:ABC-type transporter Mla subunit MlaD